MEFIHYGHDRFDKSLFTPPTNYPFTMTKPEGGLWASPVDAPYGWKDWCRENNFRWCDETNSFRFRLKDGSNVIRLERTADLEQIPRRNEPDWFTTWFAPDFEELVKRGVDAIWLTNSNALYWQLYGWDCDSILILNPDIVEEIQNEPRTEAH